MRETCPDHTDTADRAGNCDRCAARGRWYATSEQTRADADQLLRRRRTIAAAAKLRADTSAGAPPGVYQALDTVVERTRWLEERGEVDPPPVPPTVDEMVTKVRGVSAPVRVVEMVWDGDSYGWIECLVAIVEHPSAHHDRYTEMALWSGRDGNGVEVGKAVAGRLGVPFHATQPDVPDIDLPRWWDQA